MPETVSDILKTTKDLASKEKTEKKLLQTKGSVTGAMSGLAGGLMIGYFKGWNLYISGIVGVLVGTTISYFVLRDSDEQIVNKQK